MSNPFDKFDTAQTSAPKNPFDQFDNTEPADRIAQADDYNAELNQRMGIAEDQQASPEQSERGFVNNLVRGTGAAFTRVGGEIIEGAGALAAAKPKGAYYGVAQGELPIAERNPFAHEREMTDEQYRAQQEKGYAEALKMSDALKSKEFGYDKDRNSVEKTKELFGKGNWLAGTMTIPGMLTDQLAQSIPYMLSAPMTAVAIGGNTTRERVNNTNGKLMPDAEDNAIGMVVGAASGVLERIMPRMLLRQGEAMSQAEARALADSATKYALRKIGKEAAKDASVEALTEAIQSGVLEYVGQRYGTDKAMSLQEAAMQGLEGALIGGGIGGGLGAGRGAIDAVAGMRSPESVDDNGIDQPLNGEEIGGGIVDDMPVDATAQTEVRQLGYNPERMVVMPDGTTAWESELPALAEQSAAAQHPGYARITETPDQVEASLAEPVAIDDEINSMMADLDNYRAERVRQTVQPAMENPAITGVNPFDQFDDAPAAGLFDGVREMQAAETNAAREQEARRRELMNANFQEDEEGGLFSGVRALAEQSRYAPIKNEIDPGEIADIYPADPAMNRPRSESEQRLNVPIPKGFTDQRLTRPEYRTRLEYLAADLVKGGGVGYVRDENDRITGRTPSINPEWFKGIGENPDTAMSVEATQAAIQKALNGEKLGVRQMRVVGAAMDAITGERSNYARELLAMRETVRADRQAAFENWQRATNAPIDAEFTAIVSPKNVGEVYQEQDYTAESAIEDRAISELADQAGMMGADWKDIDNALELNDIGAQTEALTQLIWNLRNEHRAAPKQQPESTAAAGAQSRSGEGARPTESMAGEAPNASQSTSQAEPVNDIDTAASEAALSPLNNLPEPTEAQKEAGNYKKAHVKIQGFDIAIENPRGSTRSGTDSKGNKWEVKMHSHYGYIKRTEGADGEHVDVFIGPNPESDKVFIVDQINPDGSFDEHKVLIGFDSKLRARSGYKSNYSNGWKVGPITSMSMDEFKDWVKNGDTKKPLALNQSERALDMVPTSVSEPKPDQETVKQPSSKEPQPSAGVSVSEKSKATEAIQDLGEKIGGARKDNAITTAKKSTRKLDDSDKPAWARRYITAQNVDLPGVPNAGKWTVLDKQKKDFRGGYAPAVRNYFDTEQEAEAAIPLIAVSRNHSVRSAGNGKYEVWRTVNDRKRVKVVDLQFDSREEAALYMAENAAEIIETSTTFGEANIPAPPDRERKGPEYRKGNVEGRDFMDTFGFRGVEFGNWNNQDDRRALLNDAYDGLMDLATALNIPPKAISLNGDLALAFGARGQGLSSAKAHYERQKAVINLTKENGAGSLAHEWFHALDHYLGSQDGKASSEWKIDDDGTRSFNTKGREEDYASHGFKYSNSGVREVVRDAYSKLIKALFKKAETYVEDTQRADEFTGRARKDLEFRINELRTDLAEQKDPKYWKRNNRPASTEQLAEFDAIAQQLLDGNDLATEARKIEGGKSSWPYRMSNDSLEKISELYKSVRGRSGFGSGQTVGVLDRLRSAMGTYDSRLKMLAEAQQGSEKVKSVITNFAMDAKELDQGRGTDYWTTPHEMVARAFQGYVEDKIAEQGGVSRFLNYGPEGAGIPTPWGFKRPFPAGEERIAINKALDEFIGSLETRETDKGVLLYSLSDKRKDSDAITRDAAQAIIDRISKDWKVPVKIKLIDTIADLPNSIKSRMNKNDGGAEPSALIDESTGHVYINLSKVESERSIEELVFHEVYTHFGLRQLMGDAVSGIMGKLYLSLGAAEVDRLAKKYGVNVEAYEKAYEGKPVEMRRAIVAEELLAHMSEHTKPSVVKFAQELVGAIRAWLRKNGFAELAKISESDMRHLLKQARETVTKGKNGDFTGLIYSLAGVSKSDRKALNKARSQAPLPEATQELVEDDDLLTAWAYISQREESFQLPTSRKKDLVEIAQDIEGMNGFVVYEADELALQNDHGAENAWRIKTPGGEKASVFQEGNKVWIDVSDLESGDAGKRIYNIVANYAINTGRVFVGDPAGLSIMAKARRLENMLSSAMKFGTTRHLQPHKLQLKDGEGVPGLKWKKGDDVNNIREMIITSYEAVKNQFPKVEDLTYNPERDIFEDSTNGQEFTRRDFRELAETARGMYEPGAGGIAPSAGRTTLERAVLTHSILRGTRSEKSRILEQLGGQRSERLTEILYALPKTRPSGGFSASGLQEKPIVYGIGIDSILRVWQDKMRPLLRTQNAIKEDGGNISEKEDAYLAEEAFHGKTENDLRKMRERYLEPMAKKMADYGIEREELDMYLWAKHAKERNAQIAKINPDMLDGGSGMTNAQADQLLDQAKKEGKQLRLNELAGIVYSLLDEKRKIMRHSLADDSMVDTWNNAYKYYVPLKGRAVDDSGGSYPRVGRGFDIRGKESLRALGRRTKPESPTLHAIKDTTESIIRYRKNEVGNALLALVEANPNPDYWEAHDKDSPDFERKLLKKQGQEVVGAAKVINKEDYFITKRDGKEYYIRIEDPLLMRAMKNMGPEKMNWVVRQLAKISRFLSSMVTSYNPEFVITNFSRDIQTAILNLQAEIDLHDGKAKGKQITGKMIKSVPVAARAIYASLRNKKLSGSMAEWQKSFDDFRNDGANTGWFQLLDIEQQAAELADLMEMNKSTIKGQFLKNRKRIGDFVSNINSAVENAIRLSVYKNAVDSGITRKQAASLAKNLTVNFNRKGEVGASMNALYMFFNASVQGTAAFARAMGTMKIDENGARKLNVAQKAAIGIMFASFGLAILNRSVAGEDDDGESWWDKVPDYVKERNLVLMKSMWGGPEGEYITIPLPYGYNVFNALATTLDSGVNGNKNVAQSAGTMVKAMMGAFSPLGVAESDSFAGAATRSLAPTAVKPLADLAANENFFGSKIFAENFEFGTKKPDSHLHLRSTNDFWVWTAEFLNDSTGGSPYRSGLIDVSPDKMGYMFNYFVGGAGQFYSRIVHLGIKGVQDREIKATEVPFVRRFTGKVNWYADQQKFYDRKEEIDQLVDERKTLDYGSQERKEFELEHKAMLSLQLTSKSVAAELTRLRKQRNKITDDEDMSEKDKEEKLKPIELKMQTAINRFNAAYKKAN